jgi:GT2 family glycosyltransferase
MGERPPFFSIVIPTHRRPRQLSECLEVLTLLDYPRDRFEVIVVDDGGGVPLDETVARFTDPLRLTLLRQPAGGPSRARNLGATSARGEVLAFTGDDCLPAADWLATLATRFARRPDCAHGGTITNALPGNIFSTASHLLISYLCAYYNARPDAAGFFTPNNFAVPADRFRAVGGFDVSFVTATGEDRDFCDRWLQAGHCMVFAPEAVVIHSHPLGFGGFCRQHFDYGRGTFRFRMTRARRANERVTLEPARFYRDLLPYPFAIAHEKKFRLSLLLGVAQVANVLGFGWEAVVRRR